MRDRDNPLAFSQSQVSRFLRCEEQYAQHYGRGVRAPSMAAAAIGSAYNDGIGYNLVHKAAHERDVSVSETIEVAVDGLERRRDETEWDEPYPKAKDDTARLTGAYAKRHVPEIEPVSVEERVVTHFDAPDGRTAKFVAYTDVREPLRTIDLKTSRRKWKAHREAKELQPAAYTWHEPGETRFAFDVMVRARTPYLDRRTVTVTEHHKQAFGRLLFALVPRMVELKLDPDRARPTGYLTGAWWCSRKYCPVWRQCAARWGLPIPEGG